VLGSDVSGFTFHGQKAGVFPHTIQRRSRCIFPRNNLALFREAIDSQDHHVQQGLDCYHNHPVTLPRPDPSPPWWGVAGWAHEASPRGPGSNREGSPSVNLGRRSALPLRIFHDLLGSLAIPLKPPTSLGIVGARIDGRIFHRPPLSTLRPLSTLTLPRGQPPDFYGEFAPSVSASMVQGIPSLEAHPWGPHSYWGRIPPSLSPPRTFNFTF